MVKTETDILCPVCKDGKIQYKSTKMDIPYFGESFQTNITCDKCEFRHNDVILGDYKEPMRFSLKISKEKDLNIKVVRSASGTVRIPELGLIVEPGGASDGYISNVEGVLNRFIHAIETAVKFSKNQENEEPARKKGNEILEKISRVKKGKFKITIIMEDPYGNSAIISEKAEKKTLTTEETKKLKTGFTIFDVVHDS